MCCFEFTLSWWILASCSLSTVRITDVPCFVFIGGLLCVVKCELHVLILIFSCCWICQMFSTRHNEVVCSISGESSLSYSTHVNSFDRLLWLTVSHVFFALALVPVKFISTNQSNNYIKMLVIFTVFDIALPEFLSCSVTRINYSENVYSQTYLQGCKVCICLLLSLMLIGSNLYSKLSVQKIISVSHEKQWVSIF